MFPATSLQNHGQTKSPTKRRMYIIHTPIDSPGRLSTAAAWATKYMAHRPPTKNWAFQYCYFICCPTYEADRLPPRPLLSERRRIMIVDADQTAYLPSSPFFQPLLAMLYTAMKAQIYLYQIYRCTRNNNHRMGPILNHNRGWWLECYVFENVKWNGGYMQYKW